MLVLVMRFDVGFMISPTTSEENFLPQEEDLKMYYGRVKQNFEFDFLDFLIKRVHSINSLTIFCKFLNFCNVTKFLVSIITSISK